MLVFLNDEFWWASHINVEFNVRTSSDIVEDYFIGILSINRFESGGLSTNEEQAIPVLLVLCLTQNEWVNLRAFLSTCAIIFRHWFGHLTSFWPKSIWGVSFQSELPVAGTKAKDSIARKNESNLREFILNQEFPILGRYDLLTCVNIWQWPMELIFARSSRWMFKTKLGESCLELLDGSVINLIRNWVVLTVRNSIHLDPSFIVAD
jgi:hypothetical protein